MVHRHAELNPEKKGIEIYFDSYPGQSVISDLKAHGWRWSNPKRCWYNRDSVENRSYVAGTIGCSTFENVSAKKWNAGSVSGREDLPIKVYQKIWNEQILHEFSDYDEVQAFREKVKKDYSYGKRLVKSVGQPMVVSERNCPNGGNIEYSISQLVQDLDWMLVLADMRRYTGETSNEYRVYYRNYMVVIDKSADKWMVHFPWGTLRLGEDDTNTLLSALKRNIYNIDLITLDGKEVRESYKYFAQWILEQPLDQMQGVKEGLDVYADDFVVKGNTFHCRVKGHSVTPINANFRIITSYGEVRICTVLGGYCEECGQFFILNSQYDELFKHGQPLCTIVEDSVYQRRGVGNFCEWKDQSILKAFGYTVGYTTDVSEPQRHAILSTIIDNGILSANDVISYLDFFIEMHQQDYFEQARADWESDKIFVANYRKPERPTVNVQLVRTKQYRYY